MKAGIIKYIGRNDRNEPIFESEYHIGTISPGYKTFWVVDVEDKRSYGSDDWCVSIGFGGCKSPLDAILNMYEQMMDWDDIAREYA